MKNLKTFLLLIGLLSTTVSASQYVLQSRVVYGGGCDSYTCGINAKCTISEGRPVCSCLNLHMGDPLVRCDRVECLVDEDCLGNQVCGNNRCVNGCVDAGHLCGINAFCETIDHTPTCKCPPGFEGNGFSSCHVRDPQAACKPNPCGANTMCEVVNEVPSCKCLPGYRGTPLSDGCRRRECESDAECPSHLTCSSNFKCESPCNRCGKSANCKVVNHQPQCSCPNNWLGNAYGAGCRPECITHSECPAGKSACLNQRCTNPCEGACGENADCHLRNQIIPVCSCPRNMVGHALIRCRLPTPEDLCEPNPCGKNAICVPGHDETGAERPVCSCPRGFFGNGLYFCQRGECMTNSDCPLNKACINYYCQNPCTGHECAPTATCSPRDHIAVCTCPEGTRGDATVLCNPIVGRTRGRLLG